MKIHSFKIQHSFKINMSDRVKNQFNLRVHQKVSERALREVWRNLVRRLSSAVASKTQWMQWRKVSKKMAWKPLELPAT